MKAKSIYQYIGNLKLGVGCTHMGRAQLIWFSKFGESVVGGFGIGERTGVGYNDGFNERN